MASKLYLDFFTEKQMVAMYSIFHHCILTNESGNPETLEFLSIFFQAFDMDEDKLAVPLELEQSLGLLDFNDEKTYMNMAALAVRVLKFDDMINLQYYSTYINVISTEAKKHDKLHEFGTYVIDGVKHLFTLDYNDLKELVKDKF